MQQISTSLQPGSEDLRLMFT